VPAPPLDVLHQRLVLLLRLRPFLHSGVMAAARRPPHHRRCLASKTRIVNADQ
jgi:hypothetical protein